MVLLLSLLTSMEIVWVYLTTLNSVAHFEDDILSTKLQKGT